MNYNQNFVGFNIIASYVLENNNIIIHYQTFSEFVNVVPEVQKFKTGSSYVAQTIKM